MRLFYSTHSFSTSYVQAQRFRENADLGPEFGVGKRSGICEPAQWGLEHQKPRRQAQGPGQRGVRAGRTLTSGCLRRMCLLMEALVDTLVPHSWQLCASTLSWVSCTCFCSMYSVTYFLSHTEHVHCLPTSHTHTQECKQNTTGGLHCNESIDITVTGKYWKKTV